MNGSSLLCRLHPASLTALRSASIIIRSSSSKADTSVTPSPPLSLILGWAYSKPHQVRTKLFLSYLLVLGLSLAIFLQLSACQVRKHPPPGVPAHAGRRGPGPVCTRVQAGGPRHVHLRPGPAAGKGASTAGRHAEAHGSYGRVRKKTKLKRYSNLLPISLPSAPLLFLC